LTTQSGGSTDQRRLLDRLEMLDQRLDNLDSVVTTLVERVMRQTVTMQLTCPTCGKPVEVSLTGSVRVGKGAERRAGT